ncbi:hypothetical protein H1C71_021474 [Ictidomys tridecemlineatus]|nr:hypothetical protein H1C71_021474 [Ictidomys tridecemlineatus]KAG3268485.1 hypothetical protein H1C71_021474 [Ictidomys tridecemlineatus]KAG3268486.1 hypothetical protein H1C71_021474 [Ictidomys tridecemlineatus]
MQVSPLCTGNLRCPSHPVGDFRSSSSIPFIAASVQALVPHTTLFWPGSAASVSPLPSKLRSSSRGPLLYSSSCHVTCCTAGSRLEHGMPSHQLPTSPHTTHCA